MFAFLTKDLIREYLDKTGDTKTIDMDIVLLHSTGTRKIPLIKLYRQLTGKGLRDSKEHVDYLIGEGGERKAWL